MFIISFIYKLTFNLQQWSHDLKPLFNNNIFVLVSGVCPPREGLPPPAPTTNKKDPGVLS